MEKTSLIKIADYYGSENQRRKLIEEMGELIQAICKGKLPNIIEECADVQIMLSQVIYLLGIEKNVEVISAEKIERQLLRIKNEE